MGKLVCDFRPPRMDEFPRYDAVSSKFLVKTLPMRTCAIRRITTYPRSRSRESVLMDNVIFVVLSLYPKSPSPVHISPGVGPKPFEWFVHLSRHPQLVNLYRRVTVFCDVVLHPERPCRSGVFLTVLCSISERRTEKRF